MKAMKAMVGIFFGMSLMLQGCAALFVGGVGAGAGAATVAYVKGELQTTYASSLNQAWDASLGALKDLEIEVLSIRKDATGGLIEARRADGTTVKMGLSPAGPDTTAVKIRVGIFGNREASMAIHRQIPAKMEAG